MKQKILIGSLVASVFCLHACDYADARYEDLNTGKSITVIKDSTTGKMINEATSEPVEIYVDKTTRDTLYGPTGAVINGKVYKNKEGVYTYTVHKTEDEKIKRTADELKIKDGDYKKEVEKDGDITIKTDDKKIKIDGETGERKVKKD